MVLTEIYKQTIFYLVRVYVNKRKIGLTTSKKCQLSKTSNTRVCLTSYFQTAKKISGSLKTSKLPENYQSHQYLE